MNQKLFLAIAIILNVLILFFYIHKKNLIIKLEYQKQRSEKKLELAKKEKENLEHQLEIVKKSAKVQSKAFEKGMQKRKLNKTRSIKNLGI